MRRLIRRRRRGRSAAARMNLVRFPPDKILGIRLPGVSITLGVDFRILFFQLALDLLGELSASRRARGVVLF